MRLFIASGFERPFTESVAAVAEYARSNAERGAVKWVQPGNFHITYAFLGELGPAAAASADKAVADALVGVRAFDITMGGFGVFPSARRPSVLWVGIGEGAQELMGLAAKLSQSLAAAGFLFEDRFESHVTIGRVKGSLPETFMRRMAGYAPQKRAVSRLASVDLMQSELTSDGPVYRRVSSRLLS